MQEAHRVSKLSAPKQVRPYSVVVIVFSAWILGSLSEMSSSKI